jgi:hypothetical protein
MASAMTDADDFRKRAEEARQMAARSLKGLMLDATPNLDKLASEGMRFIDYYAEASCTAGRANFITGRTAHTHQANHRWPGRFTVTVGTKAGTSNLFSNLGAQKYNLPQAFFAGSAGGRVRRPPPIRSHRWKVQHHAGAPLVTRRDLSRQYAELIDVPIADEHLDRGYLIVGISRTVAPPFRPQAFDFQIDDRHISIVSHHHPLTMQVLSSAPNMAVSWQSLGGIWVGHWFLQKSTCSCRCSPLARRCNASSSFRGRPKRTRSLAPLPASINILHQLAEKGAKFRSLHDPWCDHRCAT